MATTQVLPAPSCGPIRSGASSAATSVADDSTADAALAQGRARVLAVAGADAITMMLQSDREKERRLRCSTHVRHAPSGVPALRLGRLVSRSGRDQVCAHHPPLVVLAGCGIERAAAGDQGQRLLTGVAD